MRLSRSDTGGPHASPRPGAPYPCAVSDAYIGVDLGGTKLSVAGLERGVLGDVDTTPTERRSAEGLIDQIVAAVGRVRDSRTAAVGVGIPSVIDFPTGRARSSVNIPLRDVPVRQILRERLELPVYIDNDATCAALAEAHDGDRLEVHDLVMFTVGTGVGGGLVLGGRPYRGATGAAGELGHMIVGADLEGGAPDQGSSFPRLGSLERLARGGELDRLAAQSAAAGPDSALGRIAASGATVAGPEAVRAATDGDPEATRILRLLGERLGIGVANAINTFDPEVVAIGGGVSTAGELLLGPAREAAARFVLPGVGTRTLIRLSRYGVYAGLRGAALLAGQELELEQGG